MSVIYTSSTAFHENGDPFEKPDYFGLSTDEKPTSYKGGDIPNMSIFVETDTGTVCFYDADSEQWITQEEV